MESILKFKKLTIFWISYKKLLVTQMEIATKIATTVNFSMKLKSLKKNTKNC